MPLIPRIAVVAVTRRSLSIAVSLVAVLLCSTAVTAASIGRDPFEAGGEQRCPFPEELAAADEAEIHASEEAAPYPRHPGISFHARDGHDGFDDHRYTTDRHRVDRLSGTSRYSQIKSVLSPSDDISSRPVSGARRRSQDLDLQIREREPTTGWTLLRDGQTSEAILEFGDRAVDDPGSSMPRAGYALARAELGDPERAIHAMRAAFRTNVETLHCAPIDARLRMRIAKLFSLYEIDDDPTQRDADNHFMRAALHYLLNDLRAAEIDTELAITDGDETESTGSLQRILRRRLFAPL